MLGWVSCVGTASGSLPLEDAIEGKGLNVLWDRDFGSHLAKMMVKS